MKECFIILKTAVATAFVCFSSLPLQAEDFKIIDIGSSFDNSVINPFTQAWSINNRGQITGFTGDNSLADFGFILTPRDGKWFIDDDANGSNDLIEIFVVPDTILRVRPTSINDSGAVVGWVIVKDGPKRGFLWKNGVFTVLGSLGDYVNPLFINGNISEAWGINNQGDIVGLTAGGTVAGAFIQRGGSMSLLPNAVGGSNGFAYDINNFGQIVGWQIVEGVRRAILWDGSTVNVLDDFGATFAEAWAVNDSGWSSGWMTPTGIVNRVAVVWDKLGTRKIGFHKSGKGFDINNLGQTVGSGGFNRFLWLPGPAYGLGFGYYQLSGLIPANSGWSLVNVHAINDDGLIVGDGVHDGIFTGFLIIPPPSGIVVNSVGDGKDIDATDGECTTGNVTANGDPECTLRAAIMEANAQAGIDTIKFNIPVSGTPVIQPISALPEITDTVLIDGATQPTSNKVEINGSQIFSGVVDGLRISAGNSKVLNLLINKFSGNGLSLLTGDSNVVDGVFIGIGPDGIEPRGNSRNGINITNSSANQIGKSIGNTIAQNGGSGVFVESGEGNTIRGNSIFSNSGLGIDLAPSGANPNDPLDGDMGANTLINTPIIDSFFNLNQINQTLLFGHVQGAIGTNYVVEIFTSGKCNSSGFGEGKTLLSVVPASADGSGLAVFEATLNHLLDSSEVFTATATDAAGNTSEFSPCMGLIHLEIVDVDEMILPNLNFIVSSIKFDRPNYTETLLDTFLTDSKGLLALPEHMLQPGDSLKVYRYLGSVPAVRHPALLGTMYSIHIDNAKFDPLGKMSYDERSSADTQKVVLDHSTFAYNMLISVEWDAELAYLDGWKPSMRKMANHLYDVSDGQMILDTVLILDNSAGWDEADVQVHANNVLWPANLGDIGTIFTRPGSAGPIVFPRTGYGSEDDARRLSPIFDPGQLLTQNHFSTLLHEFFHYALGMWDEYKNRFNVYEIVWTRCDQRKNQFNKYGVMDQHIGGEPYSSEFSTIYRYPPGCRNNRQWWKSDMSCWDQLDMMLEKTYSGVKAPVIRPDERPLAPGLLYIPGPNDNTHFKYPADMDVDVGALVVFPAVQTPPAAGSYIVILFDRKLTRVKSGSLIIHENNISGESIIQGKTSDQGKLLALGVNVGDKLSSAGTLLAIGSSGIPQWRYGSIIVGQASNQGSESMSNQQGNDLNLIMDVVNGNFPLIPRLNLTVDQLTLSLDYQKAFPTLPSVEHVSFQGSLNSFDFSVSGNSYVATITDSILSNDFVTIQAVDDSGSSFFIPAQLSMNQGSSAQGTTLRDLQFGVEVTLDSVNTSIEKSSLLTWSYPIIRSGIDSLSRQVGEAIALAFYPDVPLLGENSIAIRYADSDALSGEAPFGDKLSLQIFKWNENSFIWESIGGIVDTVHQVAAAIITQSGVYAAFTTELLPSCCVGSTGNIDCDPNSVVDIADLTVLIDHLFIDLQPLCCKSEGNIDGDPTGEVTLADLTKLIDHLFISLQPTRACQ